MTLYAHQEGIQENAMQSLWNLNLGSLSEDFSVRTILFLQ